MANKQLLQRETSNTKTAKNHFYTWSLSLAQAKLSGKEVCPHRTAGCTAVCVGSAGLAGVFPKVMEARIRKTNWFFENRTAFVAQLEHELFLANRYCERKGTIGLVRLNTFSDIGWYRMIDTGKYPNLNFYDYTKDPKSAEDSLTNANYRRAYSFNENSNWNWCQDYLAKGGTVVVVYKDIEYKPAHGKIGPMPESWRGYSVVDGDKDDDRFHDPKGVIVGLRLKGTKVRKQAACDTGFATNAFPTPVTLTIGEN